MRWYARLLISWVCVAALSTGSADLQADESPAVIAADSSEAAEAFLDVLHNERLTGDWGTVRPCLEEQGIEIDLSMTHVYQHNARGGLQTRNGHRLTGSADYEFTFDFETMRLWDGGILYIAGESSWNDDIGGDKVGNLFGVNGDAGGDEAIYVLECWFEQLLWEGRARLRLGKIDVTTDNDANAYANDETSQFLNPALINTANIPVLDVGLGAQLVVQPADWIYFGGVVADAQAEATETGFRTAFHGEDYFFSGAEFGLLPVWRTGRGKLPGAYRLGVWYAPQPRSLFFENLGGRRLTVPFKRDDLGFYFNMDQMLWKENPDEEADPQGIGIFFRYGWADEDANVVEHFWSIGGQYLGLIPSRDEDVLGIGFAQGILSDRLRDLGSADRESVLEVYYSAHLLPWLTVSPDLQYVVNPGGDGGRDALVAGIRVQMTF